MRGGISIGNVTHWHGGMRIGNVMRGGMSIGNVMQRVQVIIYNAVKANSFNKSCTQSIIHIEPVLRV